MIKSIAGFIIFGMAVIVLSCQRGEKKSGYIASVTHDRVVLENKAEKLFQTSPGDQIFYLVRHAEKDTVPANDPGLTEEGVKRAGRLANLLKKTRIDEVYSTLYMRTLLTADSLVKTKGISIKAYDPEKLSDFSDSLKSKQNLKTALIVGHSNTTPELARLLAESDELFTIEDHEYDYLFIVIVRKDDENEWWKLKFRNE